jgi:hypothetical protein
LEAQIAGFKRRAQKERKPFEKVVRTWFDKNHSKHQLNQKEMDKVINKLLGGK